MHLRGSIYRVILTWGKALGKTGVGTWYYVLVLYLDDVTASESCAIVDFMCQPLVWTKLNCKHGISFSFSP